MQTVDKKYKNKQNKEGKITENCYRGGRKRVGMNHSLLRRGMNEMEEEWIVKAVKGSKDLKRTRGRILSEILKSLV